MIDTGFPWPSITMLGIGGAVFTAVGVVISAWLNHKPLMMEAINEHVQTAMEGYKEHLAIVLKESHSLRNEVMSLRKELIESNAAARADAQIAQASAWAAAEREKILMKEIGELKDMLVKREILRDKRDEILD